MRVFSHIGIPTDKPHDNEIHNAEGGFYITEFDNSPSRVEWLRCEEKCVLPGNCSDSVGKSRHKHQCLVQQVRVQS